MWGLSLSHVYEVPVCTYAIKFDDFLSIICLMWISFLLHLEEPRRVQESFFLPNTTMVSYFNVLIINSTKDEHVRRTLGSSVVILSLDSKGAKCEVGEFMSPF